MTMKCPTCHKQFDDAEVCADDGSNLVPLPAMPARSVVVTPRAEPQLGPPAMQSATQTTNPPPPAPCTAIAATGPAAEPSGRFAGLFAKLGLKLGSSDAKEDTEASGVLPAEVKAKGWKLASKGPQKCGATDEWRVSMATPSGDAHGRFLRFRVGSLSSQSVYAAIQAQTQLQTTVPKLWQFGTANWGGARADFELSTYTAGQSLAQWLGQTPPSEPKAMHLAGQLATLLRKLNDMGLMAISLDPALVAVDQSSELTLVHAGCLSLAQHAGDAPTYHPAFARTDLLAKPYAAPELSDSLLLSDRAALFSAAQLVAAAVWGQPVSYAELRCGNVPFAAIQSPDLSALLMGCLWPSLEHRWSFADWQSALEQNAQSNPASTGALPPWASLMPGAASNSFVFNGKTYWRVEDLLAAAVEPASWDEACARMDAMLAWAMTDTPWQGQAQVIRSAMAQGRSVDWALIRFNRLARPTAPITWRGLDLSDRFADESLAALAQAAIDRDPDSRALLQRLVQADLRSALAIH